MPFKLNNINDGNFYLDVVKNIQKDAVVHSSSQQVERLDDCGK